MRIKEKKYIECDERTISKGIFQRLNLYMIYIFCEFVKSNYLSKEKGDFECAVTALS